MINWRGLILVALLAMAGAVLPAAAQQTADTAIAEELPEGVTQERLALATKFIEATFPDAAFRSLMGQVVNREAKVVRRVKPNLSTNALKLFGKTLQQELQDDLPALRRDMAKAWAHAFTDAELEELIAFFKTQTGKKLFARQPILLGRGVELGVNWGQEAGREAALRARRRLRQRGIDI